MMAFALWAVAAWLEGLIADARAWRVKATTAARYVVLAFALGWLVCDLRAGARDRVTVWVVAGAVIVFVALRGRDDG